jgi:hypothetical protein
VELQNFQKKLLLLHLHQFKILKIKKKVPILLNKKKKEV